MNPPIQLIDIDCRNEREVLQKAFDSDQGMRTTGGSVDPAVDRQNLATVVSLIEKCGMPTLAGVDDVQMNAIWAVLQHGDNATRKKYLPRLEESAKNGDLDAKSIATMRDRVLMDDGEPQVYGTQVYQKDGKWLLYTLEKPEFVNKRRAETGFGPIEGYLKRWDIGYLEEPHSCGIGPSGHPYGQAFSFGRPALLLS